MADHHPMCPVMADEVCVTVGGTSRWHDRGRPGNCRCGVRCQCALIAHIYADLRRQALVLPHGSITDPTGRPRPCSMEWPGGPCECYRADVLHMFDTEDQS